MSKSKTQVSFDGEFDAVIINPKANAIDLMDMITQRLTHLEAMTSMTWGVSGEEFRQLSDNHQSAYMWMIDRTIVETHNLVTALWKQHSKKLSN